MPPSQKNESPCTPEPVLPVLNSAIFVIFVGSVTSNTRMPRRPSQSLNIFSVCGAEYLPPGMKSCVKYGTWEAVIISQRFDGAW